MELKQMGVKLTFLSSALASAASCATPWRLPDSAWHDESRAKWQNEVSKLFTGSSMQSICLVSPLWLQISYYKTTVEPQKGKLK